MTQPHPLDLTRAAAVIMDFQAGIVTAAARDPQGVVHRASQVLAGARAALIPVIYVVHRGGRFEADTPDVEIHQGVAPLPGEQILRKTRTGAFSTTGLDVLLRGINRDTLVLMGVATSGCVLSTVRWASDLAYKVIVVADACDDPDPEVHRVLTEKVYPRQATVLTTEAFLQQLER